MSATQLSGQHSSGLSPHLSLSRPPMLSQIVVERDNTPTLAQAISTFWQFAQTAANSFQCPHPHSGLDWPNLAPEFCQTDRQNNVTSCGKCARVHLAHTPFTAWSSSVTWTVRFYSVWVTQVFNTPRNMCTLSKLCQPYERNHWCHQRQQCCSCKSKKMSLSTAFNIQHNMQGTKKKKSPRTVAECNRQCRWRFERFTVMTHILWIEAVYW